MMMMIYYFIYVWGWAVIYSVMCEIPIPYYSAPQLYGSTNNSLKF